MTKLNNEQKYEYYKKRKILRYIIIVLYFCVVVLSVCSLIFNFSCLYPLVLFIITYFIVKYRNSLEFRDDKKQVKKRVKCVKCVK